MSKGGTFFTHAECICSGVTLPVFEHYQEGGDSKWSQFLFIHGSSVQIRFCALNFATCVFQVMSSLVWPEEESNSPG